MGRWMALALAGAAGLFAAVALTASPARGDLLPTLPISVPISLPTVTAPRARAAAAAASARATASARRPAAGARRRARAPRRRAGRAAR